MLQAVQVSITSMRFTCAAAAAAAVVAAAATLQCDASAVAPLRNARNNIQTGANRPCNCSLSHGITCPLEPARTPTRRLKRGQVDNGIT
eukprot:15413-Heterococcus_DN1.PRE.2